MAKVTRSVLKSLVKECLVEILLEGVGDVSEPINESSNRAHKVKKNTRPDPMVEISKRRAALDKRRVDTRQQKISEERNRKIQSLTNDSIMQDIFKDTAETTLMNQIESKGIYSS